MEWSNSRVEHPGTSCRALAPESHAAAGVVSDTSSRKMLEIESGTLNDGNKCRVSDGAATFYASIEDRRFLACIAAGATLRTGNALIVELGYVQRVEGAKLPAESIIVRVLEHRSSL